MVGAFFTWVLPELTLKLVLEAQNDSVCGLAVLSVRVIVLEVVKVSDLLPVIKFGFVLKGPYTVQFPAVDRV